MIHNSHKTSSFTLVDMSWWKSSSRRRGIGVYLNALFTRFFDWRNTIPLWLIPGDLSPDELAEFSRTYELGVITNNTKFNTDTISTTDGVNVPTTQIYQAISGSPFERPWSLLLEVSNLKKHKIELSAVVHDLLPLEFQTKILLNWSESEQNIYREQLAQLANVAKIFATGKNAFDQILSHYPQYANKVSIIPFGENTSWLSPPRNIDDYPALIHDNYLVTISGGEWRKNLVGTLQFFSLKFPHTWKLVVICQLGKREKLLFQFKAISLGLAHRVLWAGEVSEVTKWRFLCHSKGLINLSFGEGLNLPVIEARSVKIPVIQLVDLQKIYIDPLLRQIELEQFKS